MVLLVNIERLERDPDEADDPESVVVDEVVRFLLLLPPGGWLRGDAPCEATPIPPPPPWAFVCPGEMDRVRAIAGAGTLLGALILSKSDSVRTGTLAGPVKIYICYSKTSYDHLHSETTSFKRPLGHVLTQ